jgi:hypothetical protein
LVAYRPVEPSARVQIPVPALPNERAVSRCFWLRAMQPPDRLDEGVLGHLGQVQPDLSRGFHDFLAHVKAGRNFVTHVAIFLHMIPCGSGYLMPPMGNAEAVAVWRFGHQRALNSFGFLF